MGSFGGLRVNWSRLDNTPGGTDGGGNKPKGDNEKQKERGEVEDREGERK